MSKILLNGTTDFMGIKIPVVEGGFGDGKRSMFAKDIANIHRRKLKHINESINGNRRRFKDGVDIIDLLGVDMTDTEIIKLGFTQQAINSYRGMKNKGLNSGIYILSERGYSKLVKIMDDDKSWQVHDELVDSYFALREKVKTILSETEQAILNIVNAEDEIQEALAIKSFKTVIEKPLKDEIDRYSRFLCDELSTLSKTQLATKLDTKTQTLATLFKKLGIYTKTSQVSVDFLNKFKSIKMIKDTERKYIDPKTQEEKSKVVWNWTGEGAKALVDYLIELGYVAFCENKGFKLVKTTVK